MTEDRFTKLLEVYTLEEILENVNLETAEVLSILDELGYLDDLDLLEPL